MLSLSSYQTSSYFANPPSAYNPGSDSSSTWLLSGSEHMFYVLASAATLFAHSLKKEVSSNLGMTILSFYSISHPSSNSTYLKVIFFFFKATPTALESSSARGLIGAAASGLCHSHTESEPHLPPIPKLTATLDP